MKSALRALMIVLALCAMVILGISPAMAQVELPDVVAASPGSDPEANLPYLYAVYTVTWVAFFAYLFYLSQKQRDLRKQVEELRRALAEREGRDAGPGREQ